MANRIGENSYYEYLARVLHPHGLTCPRGHPLPCDQAPHDRHRAPIVDYRCRQCGAVFNIFTNTVFSGTRHSCQTVVAILDGVAQGVPILQLAQRLQVDRSHLQRRRPAIQSLVDRGLPPLRRGLRGSRASGRGTTTGGASGLPC